MGRILQNLLALALVLAGAACGKNESGHTLTEGVDRESVREYLLAHPEMVLDDKKLGDAIRRAQLEREQHRARAKRRSILNTHADLLQSSLTPFSGDTGSTIAIIEFYDYQCAPCKASYPELEQVRAAEPNLRYIYAQLPIYGNYSTMVARAAIAANRQGLFHAFHHALMTTNVRLDMDSIYATAAEVGLDLEQLQADMDASEIIQYLEEVRRLAEALGVMGTPSFVIGDAMLRGGVTATDLTEELDRQRVENAPVSWQ